MAKKQTLKTLCRIVVFHLSSSTDQLMWQFCVFYKKNVFFPLFDVYISYFVPYLEVFLKLYRVFMSAQNFLFTEFAHGHDSPIQLISYDVRHNVCPSKLKNPAYWWTGDFWLKNVLLILAYLLAISCLCSFNVFFALSLQTSLL